MVGKLGFDWVLKDCEHGSTSPESVEMMAMAAESTGITPMARPLLNTSEAILKVMDRGAMGIQVPHVNSAEDARRAVEAVKYRPQAGRRPSNYSFGISMSDYIVEANRETLVCVQHEETESIKNVDEILQVEGVDVFFVGPSDLSRSSGYPGGPDAPEVREVISSTFARIKSAREA